MKRTMSGISLILGLTLVVPFTSLAQAQVVAPDPEHLPQPTISRQVK